MSDIQTRALRKFYGVEADAGGAVSPVVAPYEKRPDLFGLLLDAMRAQPSEWPVTGRGEVCCVWYWGSWWAGLSDDLRREVSSGKGFGVCVRACLVKVGSRDVPIILAKGERIAIPGYPVGEGRRTA